MADSPHLKAKFQIGSKRGRLNYAQDEKVFHPSDVPDKAKAARAHVERLKRPDRNGRGGAAWDFGTVAGPAQSGTKTMPWDDSGWDDRHYAAIETAALVEKAAVKMARIRAGKPEEDPRNINARWNVSTFVEPPKEMLLISVKHPLPKSAAAAAAARSAGAAGAGASGAAAPLTDRDIKRLVKKATPIPNAPAINSGSDQPSPIARASPAASAAVHTATAADSQPRPRAAHLPDGTTKSPHNYKWLNANRPTLVERVADSVEQQRATKARARLAAQHQVASAELNALHGLNATGGGTAGAVGLGRRSTASAAAAAAKSERLNTHLSELTHALGVSTSGGPQAIAAAVAAAAAAAPAARARANTANSAAAAAGATMTGSRRAHTAMSVASSTASGARSVGAGGGSGSASRPVQRAMEHTGVYRAPTGNADADVSAGWSCCLATDSDARGCSVARTRVTGQWNWTDM